VVLPRLKADLLDVMMRTADGTLGGVSLEWDPLACVGVVVASGGYPGDYSTGYPIDGLDGLDDDVLVFHAGTRPGRDADDGAQRATTDGGRVLTVTSLGRTLDEARRKAYANVERIGFRDAFYRTDIAADAW
jgi:phosphoribosylamine--glycine ligase